MKNNFTPLVDYMNSFYFEEKRKEYLEISSNVKSVRVLIFKLVDFFEELLSQPSEQIKEVFILESAPELIKMLEIYSAYGITPDKTERVISVSEKLISYIPQIEKYLPKLKDELSNLKQILNGELLEKRGSLSFPVIEKTDTESYGLMEELEISIHTNKKRNKIDFHIVPSLPKIEERLQKQIDYSWEYGVNYLKMRYKKFTPNLLVTIKYVNKLGIYEGNSLGIALTVGFIQELFKYYDLREEISIDSSISATGSMTINGEVGEVGKEIIRVKTEAVFYSPIDKFIIPQKDFDFANNRLSELLKTYPQRRLKLIPVMNIADVITRRDTLSIEKQNIITWGGRKVIRNKVALTSSILLLVILLGFYYVNQENNPHHFTYSDSGVTIYNKFNRVLWSKNKLTNKLKADDNYYQYGQSLIIDIDNDGDNEVLLTQLNEGVKGSLNLFDYKGNLIWSYLHEDQIYSQDKKFEGVFTAKTIIDTIHADNEILILLNVQHHHYFPSGIVKIIAKTGKKVGNLFWHPGGIMSAKVWDIDNDNIKEIVCGGVLNKKGRAVLFSIDIDKLNGTVPYDTTQYFKNLDKADYDHYITIPQTDFGKLVFPKYNRAYYPLEFNDNTLKIDIFEGKDLLNTAFQYSLFLNADFSPKDIVIGDVYIANRDRLVNEGKLNKPYTNSKEFKNSILENIEYWDGEKFVKYSNN